MYLPLFSCYVKPNVKSRKVDDEQVDKIYKNVDEKLRTKFLVHNFIYNLVTEEQSDYTSKNPYFYVRDRFTEEIHNKETYYLLFISTIGQSITRMYFMNRFKSIEHNNFIKACLFTLEDDIINQIIYNNDFYNVITYLAPFYKSRENNTYKLFILFKLEYLYEYTEPVKDLAKLLLETINYLKKYNANEKLADLIESLSNTIFDSINKVEYDFSFDGEILNVQNKDRGKIDFRAIFIFSLVLSKLYLIIVIELFDGTKGNPGVKGKPNKTIYLISEVRKDSIITSCYRKSYKQEGETEYQTFFTDLVSTYDIREAYNILADKLGLTTTKIKIERK